MLVLPPGHLPFLVCPSRGTQLRLHLLWAALQLLQRAPLLPLEPRAQPVMRTRSFGRVGARNGTTSPLVLVPFLVPKADTQLNDDGQTAHLKSGVPEQNAIIWIYSDRELSLPTMGTHTSVEVARGTPAAVSSVLGGAQAMCLVAPRARRGTWLRRQLPDGPGSSGHHYLLLVPLGSHTEHCKKKADGMRQEFARALLLQELKGGKRGKEMC